jgi:hypothetical protein
MIIKEYVLSTSDNKYLSTGQGQVYYHEPTRTFAVFSIRESLNEEYYIGEFKISNTNLATSPVTLNEYTSISVTPKFEQSFKAFPKIRVLFKSLGISVI